MSRETHDIGKLPSVNGNGDGWPWTTGPLPSPSGRHWPKISIVTPSFNQGRFLERTLRSVLLQGYPNLEYIVIDGGSTDNSRELLEKYSPWLTSWVSEPDRGQSHAINKGFSLANGELLCWLNSDDYFLPDALFKVAEAYLQDQSVGAIYGQGHLVDENEQVVFIPNLIQVSEENLFAWYDGGAEFMQPSCFFTKKIWDLCGPLSEDLHFAMDLDLWIKISKTHKFKKINDLLSISLKHAQAKTTLDKERSRIDVAIVYASHDDIIKARSELEKLLYKYYDCRNEIVFIYSLPIVWRIIDYFKKKHIDKKKDKRY